MLDLVLNPSTKLQTDSFIVHPSHALLLYGQSGSGKLSLALKISESLIGASDIENYPYLLHIAPKEGSISIEATREVQQFLKLKTPRNQTINRVILIEDAGLLSREAQNSLLKHIEEPPVDTVFILTVNHIHDVLPTILSRVQKIAVGKAKKEDLMTLFSEQPVLDLEKSYAMSDGRPGLFIELVTNPDHTLHAAAKYAREIFAMSSYERLLEVDTLIKDPTYTHDVLFIMEQMAYLGLMNANETSQRRWLHIVSLAYQAREAIARNAQLKLALTNFMLQL